MFDHMMMLLDSRASRMTPNQALLSLHADFIGGDNANYRKWYFAAQLDLDDSIGFANVKLGKRISVPAKHELQRRKPVEEKWINRVSNNWRVIIVLRLLNIDGRQR